MKFLRPALAAFILLSLMTGVIYPLIVTAVGKTVFPFQAGGSIIKVNNSMVGSTLIGQNFSADKYLWGRPSATNNYPYNALQSGGSNFGQLNPALYTRVKDQVEALKATSMTPAPVDLVTTSASGLDPDISIASAYFQMQRIAKARSISQDQVESIINQYAKYPLLGFFGEPRVNVLQVNLALDNLKPEEVK